MVFLEREVFMVTVRRAGEVVEKNGQKLFVCDVEVDGDRYQPELPVAVAVAWMEKVTAGEGGGRGGVGTLSSAESTGARFVTAGVVVGGVVYAPVLTVGVARAVVDEVRRAVGEGEGAVEAGKAGEAG
jgi:hypothetical protein